ncbi:MAG TPA: bifunctional DNA-binding transcriptional regulator/O6-methylguanine-DNA methyltransferase Ada [Abditibacteriaceae bacterium]|jgi:AraC family transcriptional regulator of adaptative response/methylated-DNA-[protein]-cysteine methyltransferase
MPCQLLENSAANISQDEKQEARWQAVLHRDANADGTFVYGVTSTKIFCRPSCPSRRPQRENTRFFDAPQDAAQNGFRACQRCGPEQFQTQQVMRVEQACRLIEQNLETPLSLNELAAQTGSSAGHLQRTFKQITGVSPREYGEALRLKTLKHRLQNGSPILSAQNEAGLSSRALYERAPGQLGMTPASYQKGGAGAEISFAIAQCDLGFVLAATTARGICSIALGNTPDELESTLRAEFAIANITRDNGALKEHLQILVRHLEGNEPHLNLPLDVQSTAFQRRVWQELCAIGYGQTRTYSQIAKSLGQPGAVRAVARACATNPVALAIPCHRVVREGGALAGYRWGLERKKKLLEQEKQK